MLFYICLLQLHCLLKMTAPAVLLTVPFPLSLSLKVTQLAELVGATWTANLIKDKPPMTMGTTHLLVGPEYKANPKKYDTARKWRAAGRPIEMISFAWLEECHSQGKRVDEEQFRVCETFAPKQAVAMNHSAVHKPQVAQEPKQASDVTPAACMEISVANKVPKTGVKRPRSAEQKPHIMLGGFNEDQRKDLQSRVPRTKYSARAWLLLI